MVFLFLETVPDLLGGVGLVRYWTLFVSSGELSWVVMGWGLFGLVCEWGCGKEGPTPSQLVLAFNTDMKLPEDIDRVALQIKVNGAVKHSQTYDVGPSGVKMPSTLTLVDEAAQTAPVKIRIVALSKGTPQVLRDVVTTVPKNRVALMRVRSGQVVELELLRA